VTARTHRSSQASASERSDESNVLMAKSEGATFEIRSHPHLRSLDVVFAQEIPHRGPPPEKPPPPKSIS